MSFTQDSLGWGRIGKSSVEIWDAKPVFLGARVGPKDWCKLLFYPKKWFLYRYLKKAFDGETVDRSISEPFRILDVGCGTGGALVDLKKMFGRRVDLVGADVVRLEIDIAREKIKKYGVTAEAVWYDGGQLPFSRDVFDAVYTSDVLGHVRDVPLWLSEINRVLKPGGALAMFSESELGKHAFIRRYLFDRGLNADPHAESHVSLYSKSDLKNLIGKAGFQIEKMRGVFWASFFVHPDEFYGKLNAPGQRKFFVLRTLNKVLNGVKKISRPYSLALCELYGLIEAYLLGGWIEAQGYIILAKKRRRRL